MTRQGIKTEFDRPEFDDTTQTGSYPHGRIAGYRSCEILLLWCRSSAVMVKILVVE